MKIANLPSWVNSDFTPNEGKAEIVAGIFTKYLSGKGPGLIARELNQSKVPTLSGKGEWAQGVIYKLLSNRYVIGEYEVNGETVKNYLPLVVKEEDFLKVQSKMNDNRGKFTTGNKDGDNVYNIFAGVAECSCCGNKIAVKKQGQYMTCYGKLKGLCQHGMIRYGQFESVSNPHPAV